MGETPALAATSLIVGALPWRREIFWANLLSGKAGTLLLLPVLTAVCAGGKK
jgi:hypothetical protein